MLTPEQIKERVGYLGGSDIPPILGLSRYKTLLQVWAEKTGQLEPDDISGKIQVRLGIKMEAVIAELFEEDTQKKLRRVNKAIVHPNYPFLRGHIDREIVGEDAVVEIKSTSAWRAKEVEGEDVPPEWLIQTMYYIAIGGYDHGYIAYTLGNQHFGFKRVERDPALIEQIIKRSANFWHEFVVPKVLPQIHKNDADTLAALFPEAKESDPVLLTDEANVLIEAREGYLADLKNIKGLLELTQNNLKVLLKDQAYGVTDRFKVSWKNQFKKAYTVPESNSRVFRVSKIKQEA